MSAQPNVTRWAALLDAAAVAEGLDLPAVVPLALGIISKESAGKPSARNPGSNTIGLGQQLAYVDGVEYRAKSGPPYTHPRGEQMGFRISWDPNDQIRALVGLLAHYLRAQSRAGGDLDSAWLAYAAGAGNIKKFIGGDNANHAARFSSDYAPELIERVQLYSAWYAGWARAGRPTATATVASGEGTSYSVKVARHDVPLGEPLSSPFDGLYHWNGKSRRAGPVGPDGADPSTVAGGAARSGGGLGGLLLLALVAGGAWVALGGGLPWGGAL